LRFKIDKLKLKMDEITGSELDEGTKRRGMSAAARARIGAAQTARWAKLKGTADVPAKKVSKKNECGCKGKYFRCPKPQWAEAKAAGKSRL